MVQYCIKYNKAVLLGWRVLRFTGEMLEDDPVWAIKQVLAAVREVRL